MTQQTFKFLPETPTEEMWNNKLTRQLLMWHDCYEHSHKNPENLFLHLQRTGVDTPHWLKMSLK